MKDLHYSGKIHRFTCTNLDVLAKTLGLSDDYANKTAIANAIISRLIEKANEYRHDFRFSSLYKDNSTIFANSLETHSPVNMNSGLCLDAPNVTATADERAGISDRVKLQEKSSMEDLLLDYLSQASSTDIEGLVLLIPAAQLGLLSDGTSRHIRSLHLVSMTLFSTYNNDHAAHSYINGGAKETNFGVRK